MRGAGGDARRAADKLHPLLPRFHPEPPCSLTPGLKLPFSTNPSHRSLLFSSSSSRLTPVPRGNHPGSRGTRPLQLWRSCGPSVFGPLQLLQLAVVLDSVGSLTNFPQNFYSCIQRGGGKNRSIPCSILGMHGASHPGSREGNG